MLMARRRADDISIVVRQASRQAVASQSTARTKELRRCMIRASDGRMRLEGDRGVGFKDSRRFTKVLEGQQGKYTKNGRKEGRSYIAARHGVRGRRHGKGRGGVFCLSDIK